MNAAKFPMFLWDYAHVLLVTQCLMEVMGTYTKYVDAVNIFVTIVALALGTQAKNAQTILFCTMNQSQTFLRIIDATV